MLDALQNIVVAIWMITAQMAPYLLLGFAMAGLLSVFISPAWLERNLGGRGMKPVFLASLFGVPLPLCSCGVIPVSASLRRHGASKAATTAFLLSTPQTGVDSVLVTWTMLGPMFAVFRPVIALLTGFLGGGLVQGLVPHETDAQGDATENRPDERPAGFEGKFRAAWDYATVTLPADIGRPLLIGLVIAGLLGALIPEDFLGRYLGQGPLSVALMMAVGIPIYVCATASVPLAAGFIFLGATPGAALAFLVAGPATNAATLTTIYRVLGRRVLIIFLATVALSAFGGGLLLDWILPRVAESIPLFWGHGHAHESVTGLGHLAGVLLVLVMTTSWVRTRESDSCCDAPGEGTCSVNSIELEDAEQLVLEIDGMNCSHCSESVDRALRGVEGVTTCQVSLRDGKAVVRGRSLDRAGLARAVVGLGFQVRS